MRLLLAFPLFFTTSTLARERRATSQVAVTPHVLALEISPHRLPVPASANYLTKRHEPRQMANITGTVDANPPIASVQQDLLTLGGRVYMTNITLSGFPYTVVIDTGSSDTWVASTMFSCVSRAMTRLSQATCNFGQLWEVERSRSYRQLRGYDFGVSYTGGEFLSGELGITWVGLGGITVPQVVGVVEKGWWMGDGISSGLLGLAYSTLASNSRTLNYTSVAFTLFQDGTIPAMFSLALSRPTLQSPTAGGLLAIGGIPDIPHEGDFVSVPIKPIVSTVYAFYAIQVDGYIVEPPSSTSIPPIRFTRRQQATPSTAQDFSSNATEAIIDSGTTLMYIPDAIVDYIAQSFQPPAQQYGVDGPYTVDCGARAPRVGIIIGGRTFWIDALDLVSNETVDGGRATRGICPIAVQKAGGGDVVLGDTFMRNVVVVFDLGENELRFSARGTY